MATVEIESLARLDVKPGETLVVRVPAEGLTFEYVRQLEDGLCARLPAGVNFIILGADVDLSVVSSDAVARP